MGKGGWSWWATPVDGPDETPESYGVNEMTRDAVIAAARREFPDDWIAIVEATQDGEFDGDIFEEDGLLMEVVIDQFLEANSARWGEDGDPPFMFDLAKALNTAMDGYLRANHDRIMEAAWSFTEQRNAEHLAPPQAND